MEINRTARFDRKKNKVILTTTVDVEEGYSKKIDEIMTKERAKELLKELNSSKNNIQHQIKTINSKLSKEKFSEEQKKELIILGEKLKKLQEFNKQDKDEENLERLKEDLKTTNEGIKRLRKIL